MAGLRHAQANSRVTPRPLCLRLTAPPLRMYTVHPTPPAPSHRTAMLPCSPTPNWHSSSPPPPAYPNAYMITHRRMQSAPLDLEVLQELLGDALFMSALRGTDPYLTAALKSLPLVDGGGSNGVKAATAGSVRTAQALLQQVEAQIAEGGPGAAVEAIAMCVHGRFGAWCRGDIVRAPAQAGMSRLPGSKQHARLRRHSHSDTVTHGADARAHADMPVRSPPLSP